MKVMLSFLGKDSVPFKRELDLPENVYNELKKLYEEAPSGKSEIFPDVGAGEVSAFLKEACDGISPKVLRTAKCNKVLVEELKKQNVSKDSTEQEKVKALYKANLEIAKTLNHQKNVAKNQKEQENKAKDNIDAKKERIKQLKEKVDEQLAKIKADEEKAKQKKAKDPKAYREKMSSLKAKKQKLKERLEKASIALDNAKFKYEKRRETKDINLGTSLGAYADFRIVYSWCNDMELDPRKIYSKALYERSKWAENTDKDFWKSAF